jgi:ketosteroid isomerase-like protein
MKRTATISLALIALVGLMGVVWAQQDEQPAPSRRGRMRQSPEETTAQIKAQLEGIWAAVAAKDKEAFSGLVTEDWRLYTVRANKFSINDLFTFHEQVSDFGLEMSNLKVHPAGRMAWATFDAVMKGDREDRKFGGNFIFTAIFQREREGGWKCAHLHESKKPLE